MKLALDYCQELGHWYCPRPEVKQKPKPKPKAEPIPKGLYNSK